jgi:uncharacterized protein YqeY
MTIKDQINADFMEAYKAKNMEKKNFLGVLKGAIQTQEGKNIESTDENVLKVIKSLEKGINENIEGRKASGLDTVEQELELSYIKPYQPELMSEDVIREKVRLIILEVGKANLGLLMGTFNKQNNGKAFDNKVVSNIIKEELV